VSRQQNSAGSDCEIDDFETNAVADLAACGSRFSWVSDPQRLPGMAVPQLGHAE